MRSARLTALAVMSTSTSPAAGSGSGTVSQVSTSGPPLRGIVIASTAPP